MTKLPANYKEGGEGICLLCDNTKGSTEHYFECMYTTQLVKGWGVKMEDLESQEIPKMRAVAGFIEHVEMMLQPMMEKKKKPVYRKR